MAKYDPLKRHLENLPKSTTRVRMSFREIDAIIGRADPLPASAWVWNAWWGNEQSEDRVQARAWLDAGWMVVEKDQQEGWVEFARRSTERL